MNENELEEIKKYVLLWLNASLNNVTSDVDTFLSYKKQYDGKTFTKGSKDIGVCKVIIEDNRVRILFLGRSYSPEVFKILIKELNSIGVSIK